MKSKILKSILTSALLPFTAACGMPVMYKNHNRQSPELKFGADGKFKILHLTDIHEVDPEMDDDENPDIPRDKSREAMNVIEKCLEKTQPDLVVFGGDNISGYWQEYTYNYVEKTIAKITEPIRKRNIPFAIVFGNHDSELEQFFREYQMMLYMRYDNFIGCLNAEEMHGCGNNNVIIKSSKSDKAAFNIWLIDSNDYVRDENYKVLGYDRIHQDQLDWYERTAEKLKKENGGEPLPSILFQHIPVSQEYDVIYEAGENEPCDLVEGDGKRYCIKKENFVSGHLRELPCPPKDRSREQFDLWKKHGDVIAAFFGHDHVNDFIFDIDGIKLCQTLATGFHTYGDIHGGRLIVLDENNPREFYTESIEIERITDTNFN